MTLTESARPSEQEAGVTSTKSTHGILSPIRLFNIYGDFGTGYAGNVWDVESICPTIKCENGGGNRQPLVIEPLTVPYQIVDVAALRMVRTEMGKRIRKQYERHEIHHKYSEHKKAEARKDGCSNSITTVQKDNLVMEIVRCGNVD